MVKKFLLPLLSLSFICICLLLVKSSALADTISQSYTANTILVAGSLVSLQENSSTQIVAADSNNSERLLGVVAPSTGTLINLDSNNGNTNVNTTGVATVFVSDINGEIVAGDSLTASPIRGVAMKATTSGKIIGQANAGFSSRNASSKEDIRDKNGGHVSVSLGSINANILVANYASSNPTLSGNGLISAVQAVASSTTGKNISTARALVALLVLLVAVVISVLILYTSVASSIRSIGRNPLSRHSILQGLIQVIIAVVIIMMSGFAIVYLLIGR